MKDQTATDNLHLDELTGEKVSKSELKRRKKQRLKEEQKAAKATTAPPKPPTNGIQDEEELTPNQYFEIRSKQINAIKRPGTPMDPYPHKFEVSISVPEYVATYAKDGYLEPGQRMNDKRVAVAGRIVSIRASGAKLHFYDITADGGRVQLMASMQDHDSADDKNPPYADIHSTLRRGDIIGVEGYPGKTKAGEVSVFVKKIKLLSPCLRMLPRERTGFKDQELRYRQRYLDLMINPEVRERFITRSRVISYTRRFFEELGFLEVETPIMNEIAGGAAAKPFVTHHNELKRDLFLRIATELPLKELVIGGIDRVFEIGRVFRNESIDLTHNPEFTTVEAYIAYADLHDVLQMMEQLMAGLAKFLKGSYKFTYHPDGKSNPERAVELDFTPPFRRVRIIPELERKLNVKFPNIAETPISEFRDYLDQLCVKHDVECGAPRTAARLMDKLVGHFIEVECMNPTFIMDHPRFMSPLTKMHRSYPGLVERFELFVFCREVINAYTEVNDPVDQRARFAEQAADKAAGDEEAQLIDEDYCQALEYGLPPTGGLGIGLDRLCMLMSDASNIKEVLLFPAMKPQEQH